MADAVIRIGGETILVTQRGAAGPRGLASGPLGAGSVDADTITDDGTEQALVRDKLGAASTADVAAVVASVSDVSIDLQRAAAPMPSSWPAPRVFDFTQFQGGERVNELKTIGSPGAAINGSGYLEVDNVFSDTTKRAFLRDLTFAEGVLRVQIVRGKFMVQVTDPILGGYRALWSGDGSNLEVGYSDAAGNITSIGTPIALAGTGTDIIWVEMMVGPMANGLGVNARSWKDGNARPTTPDVFGTWGSGVVGEELNEGQVSFATFSGTTSKFLRVEVYDGKGGTKATANVTLNGLWFPGLEAGVNVMRTTRGGDSLRCRVTGTGDIAIEYAGVSGVVGGYVPVGVAFVNGVQTGSPITFTNTDIAGLHGLQVTLGLDVAVTSNVEIRLRGLHEHNDKFLKAGGFALYRVTAVTAGGVVAPWPDDRPAIMGVGDSTMEGIVARGTPSTPTNSAGDASWLRLVGDALGYKALHNGFGGTGLFGGLNSSGTAGIVGSGNMPAAPIAARYSMRGRLIDFAAANVKIMLFNHGVNDLTAFIATGHPTNSEFETAAKAFVRQAFKDHAGLERFIFMPAFSNQAYKTQMQNVVTALNDPRVTMFDTTALGATLSFTDGTHPNLADQTLIAAAVVTYIRALPAPAFT